MVNTSEAQTVHRIKELHDMECPMRDGVKLATDVYMPAEGGPFPTVISRTPYDRANNMIHSVPSAISLAQQGFAAVSQDVRGRYELSVGHRTYELESRRRSRCRVVPCQVGRRYSV